MLAVCALLPLLVAAPAAGEGPPSSGGCEAVAGQVVLEAGATLTRRCSTTVPSVGDRITLKAAESVRFIDHGEERVCAQLVDGLSGWTLSVLDGRPVLSHPAAICSATDDGGRRCRSADGVPVLTCSAPTALPTEEQAGADPPPPPAEANDAAPDELATTTPAEGGEAAAPTPARAATDIDVVPSPLSNAEGQAPQAAAGEEDDTRLDVFLDALRTRDTSPADGRVLTDLVASRLGAYEQLRVTSGPELKRLLKLEAERTSLGCDDRDPGCLADLAGALGARYLVAGDLTRLEKVVLLSLTLHDTHDGRVVGRAKIGARTVEQLHAQLPAAINNLLADALELELLSIEAPPLGRLADDLETIAAATLIGAATSLAAALAVGVIGGAAAGALFAIETGPFFADQSLFLIAVAGTAAGLGGAIISPVIAGVVAPLVGIAGAALADMLADARVSAARLGLIAVVGVACGAAALVLAIPMSIVAMFALEVVAPTEFRPFWHLGVVTAGAAAVAALSSGVVVGAGYVVGVGWFGDEPAE